MPQSGGSIHWRSSSPIADNFYQKQIGKHGVHRNYVLFWTNVDLVKEFIAIPDFHVRMVPKYCHRSAFGHSLVYGNEEIVRLVMSHPTFEDQYINSSNTMYLDGRTPLMYCVKGSFSRAVQVLLDDPRCDLGATDDTGSTVFDLLASRRKQSRVRRSEDAIFARLERDLEDRQAIELVSSHFNLPDLVESKMSQFLVRPVPSLKAFESPFQNLEMEFVSSLKAFTDAFGRDAYDSIKHRLDMLQLRFGLSTSLKIEN